MKLEDCNDRFIDSLSHDEFARLVSMPVQTDSEKLLDIVFWRGDDSAFVCTGEDHLLDGEEVFSLQANEFKAEGWWRRNSNWKAKPVIESGTGPLSNLLSKRELRIFTDKQLARLNNKECIWPSVKAIQLRGDSENEVLTILASDSYPCGIEFFYGIDQADFVTHGLELLFN